MKRLFVVKRRGGYFHYFARIHDLQSLARWDIRRLASLDIINRDRDSQGLDAQNLIRREANEGFKTFIPHKGIRKRSKVEKDAP
jgi:hypothetical protein